MSVWWCCTTNCPSYAHFISCRSSTYKGPISGLLKGKLPIHQGKMGVNGQSPIALTKWLASQRSSRRKVGVLPPKVVSPPPSPPLLKVLPQSWRLLLRSLPSSGSKLPAGERLLLSGYSPKLERVVASGFALRLLSWHPVVPTVCSANRVASTKCPTIDHSALVIPFGVTEWSLCSSINTIAVLYYCSSMYRLNNIVVFGV